MTRRHATISAALAVLLTAGCGALAPPVRLEGNRAVLEPLVGRWSGEYENEGTRGRSGTIAFTLVAGEDHAHGSVLMTPAGSDHPYDRYQGRDPLGPRPNIRPKQVLTIHVVRVEDGSLYGVLDPYWDPDRDCEAWTTFRGTLNGSKIEGTFTSTYARPAAETTGRWRVTRDR